MHIIKNERPLKQVVVVKALAIILAIMVSALFIIAVTDLNPIEVFQAMIKGTFSSSKRFFNVLRDSCFLWLISIGIAPSFKMKFFNNGGEGQVLMGALISAALMINLSGKIANIVLIPLMLVSAFLFGALWGSIVAYFKVKYQTNETLFTLMMNYIAIQLVEFCVDLWDKKQSHVVGIINSENNSGWLPTVFKNQYTLVYLIALVAAVFMHFYMNHTKHGYEIDVVGESINTAKYAGIDVNKAIMRTVFVSAGFCGIAGFINVSGISHTISANTAGGKGFTAIIVAWLGKFNIWIMGLISFMLQFLSKGAVQIASQFNLNEYVSDIIIGIILFFIIGSEFFSNYKVVINRKEKN